MHVLSKVYFIDIRQDTPCESPSNNDITVSDIFDNKGNAD